MRQKINILKVLAIVQALGFGIHAQPLALGQVMTAPSLMAPSAGLAISNSGNATPAATPAATAPVLFQSAPVLPGSAVQAADGKSSGADPTPAASPSPFADRAALVPNQFQRFVQGATGLDLPLYGYNLFNGNRFNSLANVPVPANYALGPGDDIDLKIWGSMDMSLRLTVDRNGQISIPKVGTFTVAGTRAEQLEGLLRSQLGRVFTNFQLNATLGRLRSIQVYVVGQARQPGAYNVSGLSTLISALFESGGPSATGSMRNIQLVRAGQTVSTLDLYNFIHSGQTTGDTRLMPGDVIVIPPAGPRVALLGALDTPAIYELRQPQESLQALLSYSGGLNVIATPHKALVERINPANGQAPRSVQERSLDTTGLQSTVRDGDIVTLFPISPQFSNAITLRGNVAAPLRYSFVPGMRVSDLIPEPQALIQSDYYTRKNIIVQYESGRAVSGDRVINDVKNLLEEINWDYAAIERLDPVQVRTVLIPFNLGRAIKNKDPAHNLQLQAGDVVTVFGVRDLPVPMEKRNQFVRIAGEVKVPGVYQITPGETLPQLLERAGGYSANAFPYGTNFSRESTRQEQQANLDKAIRKLEQDINGQVATQLQNVTDSDKGSGVQAQIAGQRILLSRLQSLRASGRIALEMSPNKPELPPLALEDGDNILVPHRPSFVGVYGAVQSETSFIFRPGQSVGHYIDKAGLTREADLEAAIIIRADGTVQSNQASRSLLGMGHRGFMGSSLNPGDTVFVPEVLDRRTAYSQFMQGAKDWTTILFQFGLGAAALKTIRQ
jgi:protein involved in polysaccharide export with SLBB domain